MHRLSIRRQSRRPVGSTVVTLRVRATVGWAFSACGAVGSAVVTLRVRTAVGWAFSACGAVGSAVVSFGVGATVGRAFSAAARGRDVVIVECHGNHLLRLNRGGLSTGNLRVRGGRGLPPMNEA